jgi:hypothetical protein
MGSAALVLIHAEKTMTDDRTRTANGDNGRTYAGQGYEVTRFARKHGITRQQARDLIRRIGHDRHRLNEAAADLKRQEH